LPSAQLLQRDPLRFLSMLLGRMGLKQKRVGKAALGLYHLDVKRINLLNALIMRLFSFGYLIIPYFQKIFWEHLGQ